MALIKCPECGRENTSDSAEACPTCGYSIRKHFNSIKEAEKQKQLQIEDEQKRVAEREDAIKNVPMPEKPVINIGGLFIFILSALFSGFMVYALIDGTKPMIIPLVGGALGIFIAYYSLNYTVSLYKNSKKRYHLALNNFTEYQRISIELQEKWEEKIKDIKAKSKDNIPSCPNCKSDNTSRISSLSKIVSVDMLGLASNSIGKQYVCFDCKHKW